MTTDAKSSAADLDLHHYYSMRDNSHKDLLAYAAKKSGRSVLAIQREFSQMAKSDARLNMVEYIRTGLYDLDRFTPEQRAEFLSNDLHWPITHTCNNKRWTAAAEDKALAGTLLQAGGVAVPESLAVIDTSARLYPGLTKIDTAEGLNTLLMANSDKQLFGKVTDGMVSFGAFRVEKADDTHIHCSGHAPMTYADFLNDFVADNAYIVQSVLSNHDGFAKYCSALATVRMVNLVRDNDVFCPVAIIKMPQGDNIADAFWRPGNLACSIDVDTGEIKTVVLRGVETEFLDDHPEVAGLMGLKLPCWDELRDINDRAARIFAPIRYQSTDIAITPDGPVVVELNYGGGFDLPQYASRRGMLTPEVRAFFEGCGYDFAARPKRKKLFGLI
ncbi:hypothetical protein shim_12440 [Shimia sp. SK013]|uniref:sugar-transfer associated ATP-grasp domain-containing protein n=1 Tax=Shimia sp. SK013 TaxID=1389006 RepID=UPI0006B5D6CD|nr:sugar-transfer associated ATP-grasp domain-containing protein [Shimia sp. SK013]KPA22951.1 hypothetical protein shim_12440 [Shimia sp. SK013]